MTRHAPTTLLPLRTSNIISKLAERASSGPALGLARVGYLGLVGLAFLYAASVGDPEQIGLYALVLSVTSIGTVVLQAGLDRALLVEISESGVMSNSSWRVWAVRRAWLLPTAVIALLCAQYITPFAIVGVLITVTRIVITDLESILIATTAVGWVVGATMINGLITGLGMIAGAHHGANHLLWASAVGNVLALAALSYAAYKKRHRSATEASTIELSYRTALPFAGMAASGAIYQRIDILLLASFGIAAPQLASFAIASRIFEATVAFRGAIVQRTASKWTRVGEHGAPLTAQVLHFAKRSCLYSGIFGACVLILANVAQQQSLLSEYERLWPMVIIIGTGIPLLASHALTSSLIYSRPGSFRTLGLSVSLAALSSGITVGAILGNGILAVAAALAVKEYLSFLVFLQFFKLSLTFPQRTLLVLMWPFVTLLLVFLQTGIGLTL